MKAPKAAARQPRSGFWPTRGAVGHTVLATREPGGTRIGNAVRNVLLDADHVEMSPRAETLLFNAARVQIVDQVIRPALAQGQIVLCDRYADSTLAYQGFGHGQDPTNCAR
ncbi:MAG: dTMP kinase [Caldilineaceae bacterium]